MKNFKYFYLQGMQAKEKLDTEKNEIIDVFEQLNKDIKEVTNGKINIVLKKEYDVEDDTSKASLRITDIFSSRDSREDFIVGEIFIAGSPFPHKIAKFCTSDEGGYPCKILYKDNDATAFDKESLFTILGDLISSPRVATIFKMLLEKSD